MSESPFSDKNHAAAKKNPKGKEAVAQAKERVADGTRAIQASMKKDSEAWVDRAARQKKTGKIW